MSHYIDIHLRQDPEFKTNVLMNALFAKLHRALVQLQATTIGVSFPGYSLAQKKLGDKLRLIGPERDLRHLMELDWLNSMRGHLNIGPASPVPDGVQHRALRRVQAKSNPDRLRRRQMRRHGLTESQARERIPDEAAEYLDLPFMQLTSASTGQHFSLYLNLTGPSGTSTPGSFNAYGLSSTATVPWF